MLSILLVCLLLSNWFKVGVWSHVNIGFDQCFVRVLCFFWLWIERLAKLKPTQSISTLKTQTQYSLPAPDWNGSLVAWRKQETYCLTVTKGNWKNNLVDFCGKTPTKVESGKWWHGKKSQVNVINLIEIGWEKRERIAINPLLLCKIF